MAAKVYAILFLRKYPFHIKYLVLPYSIDVVSILSNMQTRVIGIRVSTKGFSYNFYSLWRLLAIVWLIHTLHNIDGLEQKRRVFLALDMQ